MIFMVSVTVSSAFANVWIRVNQAGYVPGRSKVAVVLSDTDVAGQNWSLEKDGNSVLSGTLSASAPGDDVYAAQAHTYTIDFSSVQDTGTYTLKLAGAQSPPIRISRDPYSLFATQALMHLRAMRSGGPARLHNPSHLGDSAAIVYTVKGGWIQGAWQESSPKKTVDMRGGHYDAGDYIKFTLNEAYVAWHLLTAYQENPSLFVKVQSASSLPDVLDEAKYSLDYLAKTFPDANTFVIQVGDGKDHNQGWRMPEMDALDGKRPALCALSRVHMGSAAAALALGAQVFQTLDAPAAAIYREKAIAIYARARQPDAQASAFERDATNDFYYDATDADNMALAAAELYRLTGTSSYLDEAKAYAPPAAYEVSWGDWNFDANHLIAKLGDTASKTRAQNEASRYENDNIWQAPGNYTWGTLHRWIGMANAHMRSQRDLQESSHSEPFLGVLDYTFGRNNWGISMLASADLPYSIQNIYNGIYRLTEAFPVGALSEGPGDKPTHDDMTHYFTVPANSSFEKFNTSAGVFYDNADDFMIQESTVGGQSDLILMLALASAKDLSPAADSGTVPVSNYPTPDEEESYAASGMTWITYNDKSEGGLSEASAPVKIGVSVSATLDTRDNATLGYAYSGLKGTFPASVKLDSIHGIRLVMNIPEGASVRFNLIQSNITNYAYYGKSLLGKGESSYVVDFSNVALPYGGSNVFDPSKINAIEFVNQVTGQNITLKVDSIILYRYDDMEPYIPSSLKPGITFEKTSSLYVRKYGEVYFLIPSIQNKFENLFVFNLLGRQIARLMRSNEGFFEWNASRMPAGIYQIRSRNGSATVTIRKH